MRGEDVYSRVIYGARTALMVIVLSLAISLVVGVVLGLVSGYLSGWLDRMLVLVMDALYAMPSLLLAIVVSVVSLPGSPERSAASSVAAVAIMAVFVPQYFRVVRNATSRSRPNRLSTRPGSPGPARRESCSGTSCPM